MIKNNINLINYIPKFMHGSLVTINDYNLNLKDYYNINMYIKCYEHNTTDDIRPLIKDDIRPLIKHNKILKDYMILNNPKVLKYNSYMSGINVTVSWAFRNLDWSQIKGDILIVLESLDIYLLDMENNLDDVLKNISNNFKYVYILANPMNLEVLKKYNYKNIDYIEYYVKLSKERLDKMKDKDPIDNRTLIRHEMLKNKYKNYYLYNSRLEYINTMKFEQHAFCRIGTHYDNIHLYMENIGKLIFEYLYMNRNLDYYNYNRVGDDGVHYYMQLIGLDDRDNHMNLRGYDNIVKEKLLFHDNDLLLDLIESVR